MGAPAPRRAGWFRVSIFLALGAACAYLDYPGVAALFALVGLTIAWIDYGMKKRSPP